MSTPRSKAMELSGLELESAQTCQWHQLAGGVRSFRAVRQLDGATISRRPENPACSNSAFTYQPNSQPTGQYTKGPGCSHSSSELNHLVLQMPYQHGIVCSKDDADYIVSERNCISTLILLSHSLHDQGLSFFKVHVHSRQFPFADFSPLSSKC
jgi:hypothetical protein